MSDVKQCHDLLDSTKRLFGISIDLVDREIRQLSNGRLRQLIESKPVREAVEKVLKAAADSLLAVQQAGKSLELSLSGMPEWADTPTSTAFGMTPRPSGTAGLHSPRADINGTLNFTVYLDPPKKR